MEWDSYYNTEYFLKKHIVSKESEIYKWIHSSSKALKKHSHALW